MIVNTYYKQKTKAGQVKGTHTVCDGCGEPGGPWKIKYNKGLSGEKIVLHNETCEQKYIYKTQREED